MIGIYCITNLINNKKYVGQSVNLKKRLYKHKYLLKNNKHYNRHLQNALKKKVKANNLPWHIVNRNKAKKSLQEDKYG